MRVVSGIARGIKLTSLEGEQTRPTTDRVKEAMFSMIQMHIRHSKALDLFCGSGALGIELLSRGAKHVDFVDHNPSLSAVLNENLSKTRLDKNASVVFTDVYQFLSKQGPESYDIIVMDPPYVQGHVLKALKLIEAHQLLSDDGIVLIEHQEDDSDMTSISSYFNILKAKKYGKIGVTLLRRSNESSCVSRKF